MIAYLDCFSGAAGDMLLAAQLDAGLELSQLRGLLGRMNVSGYELHVEKTSRNAIAATNLTVKLQKEHQQPRRNLADIEKLIRSAELPQAVVENALKIFTRLAEAEAKIHNTSVEEIHFHECGAVDTIVDVVGFCIGLELLGIKRLYSSPLTTGMGTVRTRHGLLPIPAPATAELLRGVPITRCQTPHELTTPTGAAVVSTLTGEFGAIPAMVVRKTGYGAGKLTLEDRPNVLRIIIGQPTDTPEQPDMQHDEIWQISANIDDVTGEMIGHLSEQLLAAGALDVFTIPIYMKKNRPGVMVSALTDDENYNRVEDVFFAESTTFGLRRARWRRSKLSRRFETVQTRYGDLRVKLGLRNGKPVTVSPEFEDCRRAAETHGVPLKTIMAEVMRAFEQHGPHRQQ